MSAGIVRALIIGAAFGGLLCQAAAQEVPQGRVSPDAAPVSPPAHEDSPIAVGPDWRYEKQGTAVHMFVCEQARCVPSSRVSFRFYPPNTEVTFEQFRRQQETIVKTLEGQAPPGTHIAIVEVTSDEGSGAKRMFTSRRLMAFPNGMKEYVSSSILFGSNHSATLVSSSSDEGASRANHGIFVHAVMPLINGSPESKP
jgi:hypothetical protein